MFRGSLAVMVADNLASHSISGFKETFSCFRSCRFCVVTESEMCTSINAIVIAKKNIWLTFYV